MSEQVCFGCSQEVFVVGVDVDMGDIAVVKGPVLLFYSNVIVSLCEDQKCLKKCKNILDRDLKLCLIYSKRAYNVEKDKCGCCARVYPGLRGHRCSRCLTKLYCGEKCRDMDWVVHKLICRKGEVVRKKKGDRQERKQKGSDQFERQMAALGFSV